jgi:hypothetical protein
MALIEDTIFAALSAAVSVPKTEIAASCPLIVRVPLFAVVAVPAEPATVVVAVAVTPVPAVAFIAEAFAFAE